MLIQYGVLDASAVIAWADAMIVEMETPPDSLLELSTTAPDKTAEILSCLRRLSTGADFWTAFRSALPMLRDYVASHRDRAESIASHLFLTACGFGVGDVPEDLHFVYRFDDAFSLSREGTYGDPETVYREFIHSFMRWRDLQKWPNPQSMERTGARRGASLEP